MLCLAVLLGGSRASATDSLDPAAVSAIAPGAPLPLPNEVFPPAYWQQLLAKKEKLLAEGLLTRAEAYLALKSVFTRAERSRLCVPDRLGLAVPTAAPDEVVRRHLKPGGEPYLQQLLRLDLSTWLPDDLLVKVDRMTMAHGVEARVPYLDHRVVEAVMRMPPEWKLKGFTGKRILREVSRKLLPPEIVARRKMGFGVPVGEWAAGEMREMVRDLLGPESVKRRGLFNPVEVERLATLPRYSMFERRRLWTLICLELWCREFLNR